jgi:hypothetical protein
MNIKEDADVNFIHDGDIFQLRRNSQMWQGKERVSARILKRASARILKRASARILKRASARILKRASVRILKRASARIA